MNLTVKKKEKLFTKLIIPNFIIFLLKNIANLLVINIFRQSFNLYEYKKKIPTVDFEVFSVLSVNHINKILFNFYVFKLNIKNDI